MLDSQSITEPLPVSHDYFGWYGGSFLEVMDTQPAVMEVEEFQYAYKCRHCNHQWVEIKERDVREA